MMDLLRHRIDQLAKVDLPVLIRGETGTGKEVAARMLHAKSPRRNGPFVVVNCGALQATTAESEFFGTEKGVYTGADQRRDGLFHQAAGGTLFLDEIGELPAVMQSVLLRVLDFGEVRRIGSARAEHPNVRVIAATNRDLRAEVEARSFRRDLYHRLAVFVINMPALRDHAQDVATIATAMLENMEPGLRLSPAAIDRLERHTWPGNVRELRNVMFRAKHLAHGIVRPGDVEFDEGAPHPAVACDCSGARREIEEALRRSRGNQSQAARLLGMKRTTFRSRVQALGIEAG